MWLLPAEPGPARVRLPPGQHLIPWHYTPHQREALIALLRWSMPGPLEVVCLPREVLSIAANGGFTQGREVLLVWEADEQELVSDLALAARVPVRYQLIYAPTQHRQGYGWLERYVKPPIIRALRRSLAQGDHPLEGFGVQHLPLRLAASLTSDPLEVLEILQNALSHRLRYAADGVDASDYQRSLLIAAGDRLAERLKPLPVESLQAALEVLISPNADAADAERTRMGRRALGQRGLASGGDRFRWGPLARGLRAEAVALGRLIERLPADAWTAAAQEAFQSLSRPNEALQWSDTSKRHDADTNESRPQGEVLRPGLPIPLSPPLRQALEATCQGVAAFAEALITLEAVEVLQPWVELGTELQERLSASTVRLGLHLDAQNDEAIIARSLMAALRVASVSNPAGFEEQARTVDALAVDTEASHWRRRLSMRARLRSVSDTLQYSHADQDITRADSMSRSVLEEVRGDETDEAQILKGIAKYSLGLLAELQGAFGEADRWYSEALALQKALRDRAGEALCHHQQGSLAQLRGDLDAASAAYARALEMFEVLDEAVNMAAILQRIGQVEILRGSFSEALETYQRAEALSRKENDQNGVALSLYNQGIVNRQLERYAEALSLHQRAITLFETIGNYQQAGIGCYELGQITHILENYEEALEWFRRALTAFRKQNQRNEIAQTYRAMGLLALDQQKYEAALEWFGRAQNIFDATVNHGSQVVVRYNIGRVLRTQERYEEAQAAYRGAFDLMDEHTDLAAKSSVSHELGKVAEALEDYDEAIIWHLVSLDASRAIGEQTDIAISLRELGANSSAKGLSTEATTYYQAALEIYTSQGDTSNVAIVTHQMGVNEELEDNLERASGWHKQSLAASEELGDVEGVRISQYRLASIAMQQQDWDVAVRNYRGVIALSEQLHDDKSKADALYELGRALGLADQAEKAIAALEEAHKIFSDLDAQEEDFWALFLLGIVCQDEPAKALAWYELALALADAVPLEDRASLHQQIADFHYAADKLDASLFHAVTAFAMLAPLDQDDAKLEADELLAALRDVLGAGAFDAAVTAQLGPESLAAIRQAIDALGEE